MPKISIEMYEGRTEEQKKEIVDVFTKEMSRIINREPEFIKVHFNEIPLNDNAPGNVNK